MAVTDLYDEDLYQALGEIDTRKWGARLRIVAVIRREQRLSQDGVARIGNHELARRAGITSAYCWKLTGTGKSAAGLMWRVEHVLELVDVGKGSRATGWRIRPIQNWRGVPWIEEQREIRRLRLVDGHQRADELAAQRAADEASSRLYGATQAEMASRSYGATLDSAASRWRTRRYLRASVIPSQRDANPEIAAPPPSVVVADVPSAPPQRRTQEEEKSSYAKNVEAAVFDKTGGVTFGRIDAAIRRLEEDGVDLEWLVRAIRQAPGDLKIPKIFDVWIPKVLASGIPEPATSRPVGISAFVDRGNTCPECHGRKTSIDDDGNLIPCPVCCLTPLAE